MFTYNSTNNCSPICNYTDPCSTTLSYNNCNNIWINNKLNNYRTSNCYRPLQQFYKIIYNPMCRNNSSHMCFTCICCPSERYKTTNMTYGNFYYNTWTSTRKHLPINYDRSVFIRCYDDNNNNNKMRYQSLCNNRVKNCSIIPSQCDPQEIQCWTQPTSNICCPTDCCNNPTYITTNCIDYSNNNTCCSPCSQTIIPSYSYQTPSTTTNKICNMQVQCV
ncbi:unnamed protein product [Rotaria sordida]|uniref:Uncharacterized protein n=1 Tax=Rotaria sordida TaxID=392033 RepID=A0A813TJN7_9BILA|nr:unnamed protein product [Rotaria sordida]